MRYCTSWHFLTRETSWSILQVAFTHSFSAALAHLPEGAPVVLLVNKVRAIESQSSKMAFVYSCQMCMNFINRSLLTRSLRLFLAFWPQENIGYTSSTFGKADDQCHEETLVITTCYHRCIGPFSCIPIFQVDADPEEEEAGKMADSHGSVVQACVSVVSYCHMLLISVDTASTGFHKLYGNILKIVQQKGSPGLSHKYTSAIVPRSWWIHKWAPCYQVLSSDTIWVKALHGIYTC